MAETTTITKPAPIIEGSLTAFLKSIDKLGAGAVPSTFTGIDTSVYDPKVAGRSQLQQTAATDAAGLASLVGPQAYEQFMSPYQQQVMDATLSEFDRQQTIGQVGLRDQAIQAGAYGGGREGVMQAEYMNQGGVNRANLQAQLLASRISTSTSGGSCKTWQARARTWWISKSQLGQATTSCMTKQIFDASIRLQQEKQSSNHSHN
jgi:hypothetical protein